MSIATILRIHTISRLNLISNVRPIATALWMVREVADKKIKICPTCVASVSKMYGGHVAVLCTGTGTRSVGGVGRR
eukprot:scaffold450660_cov37-Prasinocladus_malaysianus.AAC.1